MMPIDRNMVDAMANPTTTGRRLAANRVSVSLEIMNTVTKNKTDMTR
jgi:hypothetical protein